MKTKDLKINFRYLGGNIACLSVDSIDGESVHNDINDEEAIIIFNSLIGEKENCQTVKTLLKENQELRKLKTYFIDDTGEKLEYTLDDYMTILDINIQQNKQICELKKQLKPNYYVKGLEGTLKEYQQEMNKVAIQQKEFIKYLENMLDDENDIFSVVRVKDVLQKYKSIIGDKQ